MRIFEFTKERREEFDRFVGRSPWRSLLQTWVWGELSEAEGRRVFRIGVEEGGKLRATAQVVEQRLPFGRKYLYVPRGPILDYGDEELQDYVLGEVLVEMARRKGAAFVRVDPKVETGEGCAAVEATLRRHGYRRAARETQPRDTIVVDLARDEDKILAGMKSKWRYNVRLAGRKGVKVEMVSGADGERVDAAVDEFVRLMKETTERDGFSAHEAGHYEKLLKILGEGAAIFLAKFEGEVIAAILVTFYGGVATYLHGASARAHRNLMAPHLLQWEAMREARRRECAEYDLFGVAPEGVGDEHSWAGITRFKEGFGGRRVRYVGGFERPVSKFWYIVFRLAKRVRG